MVIGNAYTRPALSRADLAMAAECAAIGREFPGWDITWTASRGFRARKGDDKIGPCTSRMALIAMLALERWRAAG